MAAGVESLGRGLVKVPEAARYLGLSRSKVYELMDKGELRYAKFGSSRRIPVEAVEDYVNRSMRGGVN